MIRVSANVDFCIIFKLQAGMEFALFNPFNIIALTNLAMINHFCSVKRTCKLIHIGFL